ncbi:MAG: hypothetical protein RLZZ428_305 [Pseudomonadota bacterium]
MINKPSTIITGFISVGIYFFVIGILIYYFNVRHEQKALHFVEKNENRISVSMSSPEKKPTQATKNTPKKTVQKKVEPKKVEPKKPEPPKPVEPKPIPKEVIKKEVVKKEIVKKEVVKTKPKEVKKVPPKKKSNPNDLFKNIPTPKKIEKPTPKQSTKETPKTEETKASKNVNKLFSDTLKEQKTSDKGIENAYLAKIEQILKGWPAQSEYVGEKATVWIKVQQNGLFEFKVISASNNEAFNEGLTAYLEQLQRIGFGRHTGNRPYELNVEFVATE